MLMQLDDARNMVMSSHDSASATATKAEEAVFSSSAASTNVASVNAKHHKSPSLSSMNALPHQNTNNQWSGSSPEAMALAFGENRKAHMAARAMFELVHQFGDNLREGWKNVLDLLLQLLRADLLPVQLLLLEDFVDPRGKVSLKERFRRRQAVPKKEESGLFSWLGFTSSSGPNESDAKRPSEEERELFKLAASVISECHPEQLVPDSRYLASSALTELINNIVHCSIALAPHEQAEHVVPRDQQQQHESQGSQSQDDDSLVDLSPAAALLPKHEHGQGLVHHQQHEHSAEKHTSNCSNSEGHGRHSGPGHPPHSVVLLELSMEEEEALVFLLELMVNIVLENRDRLAQVWPLVSDHLGWLLSHFPRNRQPMERAVVSLVRIANRNLFRLGQQQQPGPVAKASELPWKKGGGGGQNMAKSVVIVVDEDEQQKETEEFKAFSHGHNHPPDQSIQGRTNECLADLVLHFMGTRLLALRPPELFLHSRPIAYGLHTLLRANAANVHSGEHWSMFFELLEAVGAAQYPEGEGEEAEQYFLVEPNKRANATSKSKSRKSAAQHARAVHVTAAMAQSEPEEMAASPERRQQLAVDERGYCSDEPSSAMAMECGQKEERKRQNPLLAAAEQLRLPHLGKADSGEEWIHVVGPAAMQKAVDEQQQQQLGQIREHSEPSEQLQFGAMSLTPAGHELHVQTGIPPQSAIASGTNDGQQNQAEQQFHAPQVQAVQPQQQQPEQPVPSSPPEAVDEPAAAAVPVPLPPPPPHPRAGLFKRGTIVLAPHLSRHDPAAFLRVVDTLVFLARDAAHITPANFTQFTRCLRVMVEASMDGGKCAPMSLPSAVAAPPAAVPATAPAPCSQSSTAPSKQFPIPHEAEKQQKPGTEQKPVVAEEERMSEQERLANCYMDASLQLLNICAQLHGLAANIHADWSNQEEEGDGTERQEKLNANATSPASSGCTELWSAYWRPLLQAMARMCCDCRRRIRAQALDALGTAFRVPALGRWMGPADWEDCFAEVLFPLLGRLLSSSPPISPMDPLGMEEARIRAIQLACKVLLGHLTQIGKLDTFADLLRRLFDLFDQFLEGSSACSDLLAEVVQESLKNCVLVCESFGIFQGPLEGLRGEMAERLGALAKKHGAETATSGGLKWG